MKKMIFILSLITGMQAHAVTLISAKNFEENCFPILQSAASDVALKYMAPVKLPQGIRGTNGEELWNVKGLKEADPFPEGNVIAVINGMNDWNHVTQDVFQPHDFSQTWDESAVYAIVSVFPKNHPKGTPGVKVRVDIKERAKIIHSNMDANYVYQVIDHETESEEEYEHNIKCQIKSTKVIEVVKP